MTGWSPRPTAERRTPSDPALTLIPTNITPHAHHRRHPKGRRIESPDWDGLRPTSDRLRETLFNVLAPHIDGARFLDAFAGTGAVGIEALSRELRTSPSSSTTRGRSGSSKATCASRRERPLCYYPHRVCAGIPRRRNAFGSTSFFSIRLDGRASAESALDVAAPLTTDGTLLVIEHARRDEAPVERATLRRIRVLTSGDSALGFYRRLQST